MYFVILKIVRIFYTTPLPSNNSHLRAYFAVLNKGMKVIKFYFNTYQPQRLQKLVWTWKAALLQSQQLLRTLCRPKPTRKSTFISLHIANWTWLTTFTDFLLIKKTNNSKSRRHFERYHDQEQETGEFLINRLGSKTVIFKLNMWVSTQF